MAQQVNLLPKTKQEKIQASRVRQLSITIGSIILLGAVALPLILFISKTTQGIVLKRTQASIDKNQATIEGTPNIVTMLTVQQHLDALPGLYSQRVYVSDLFNILPNVINTDVKLTSLKVTTDGTIQFVGTSSSYGAVNKFFVSLNAYGANYDPNKVSGPVVSGKFSDLKLENVTGISGNQVTFTINGRYSQSVIAGNSNGQ